MAQPLSHADVLGVFVKVPTPGHVKTRLAQSVGADHAAALYRFIGRQVVAQCVDPGGHRTAIWFAPSGGEAGTRAWLEWLGVDDFLSQPDGGLGVRLTATFDHHFAHGARRVVVIGSDCPDVGRELVHRAFAALEQDDLVVGPAVDGGFYLLGLNSPAPELFRDIEWSTDAVYRQTMTNAGRLGLSMAVLPELQDVDTVDDARALGLLPPVSRGQLE